LLFALWFLTVVVFKVETKSPNSSKSTVSCTSSNNGHAYDAEVVAKELVIRNYY